MERKASAGMREWSRDHLFGTADTAAARAAAAKSGGTFSRAEPWNISSTTSSSARGNGGGYHNGAGGAKTFDASTVPSRGARGKAHDVMHAGANGTGGSTTTAAQRYRDNNGKSLSMRAAGHANASGVAAASTLSAITPASPTWGVHDHGGMKDGGAAGVRPGQPLPHTLPPFSALWNRQVLGSHALHSAAAAAAAAGVQNPSGRGGYRAQAGAVDAAAAVAAVIAGTGAGGSRAKGRRGSPPPTAGNGQGRKATGKERKGGSASNGSSGPDGEGTDGLTSSVLAGAHVDAHHAAQEHQAALQIQLQLAALQQQQAMYYQQLHGAHQAAGSRLPHPTHPHALPPAIHPNQLSSFVNTMGGLQGAHMHAAHAQAHSSSGSAANSPDSAATGKPTASAKPGSHTSTPPVQTATTRAGKKAKSRQAAAAAAQGGAAVAPNGTHPTTTSPTLPAARVGCGNGHNGVSSSASLATTATEHFSAQSEEAPPSDTSSRRSEKDVATTSDGTASPTDVGRPGGSGGGKKDRDRRGGNHANSGSTANDGSDPSSAATVLRVSATGKQATVGSPARGNGMPPPTSLKMVGGLIPSGKGVSDGVVALRMAAEAAERRESPTTALPAAANGLAGVFPKPTGAAASIFPRGPTIPGTGINQPRVVVTGAPIAGVGVGQSHLPQQQRAAPAAPADFSANAIYAESPLAGPLSQALLSQLPPQQLALGCVNRNDGHHDVVIDAHVGVCEMLQLNITRFFAAVTPLMDLSVPKGKEGLVEPSYRLRDLWRFYDCPAGMAVAMHGDDSPTGDTGDETNYFVPHLSAFQLFRDDSAGGDAELWAEWYSMEKPDCRVGLWETVSELVDREDYFMLMEARSTELSHHSWYAVTWTPILHVSSRRKLEGSLITYHLLRQTRPMESTWTLTGAQGDSDGFWRERSSHLRRIMKGTWQPPPLDATSIDRDSDATSAASPQLPRSQRAPRDPSKANGSHDSESRSRDGTDDDDAASCCSSTAYSYDVHFDPAPGVLTDASRGTLPAFPQPDGFTINEPQLWPTSMYIPIFGFIPYKLQTSTWFMDCDRAQALGVPTSYRSMVHGDNVYIGPLHLVQAANELVEFLNSEYKTSHNDFDQCVLRMPSLKELKRRRY